MEEALKQDLNYSCLWVALMAIIDKSKNEEDMKKIEYESLSQTFSSPYMKALFNFILFKEDSIHSILVLICIFKACNCKEFRLQLYFIILNELNI